MAIATISNTVSATNGTQFSASMWVIPPADGSNPSAFGHAVLAQCETNDANLNTRIQVYLDATSSAQRYFRCVLSNFTTGNPSLNKTWAVQSLNNSYTPGSWHHLFLCGDTSSATLGYCVVNAVDVTRTALMSGNNTGFSIPWNGCKFGIPTTPAESSGFTATLRMAEVQMWLGTFIDPTVPANLAKFVRIVNNVGRPQNPTLAATAFGTPTYSFRGNKFQFPTNRGNGGSMSSAGTINSYTPVPG